MIFSTPSPASVMGLPTGSPGSDVDADGDGDAVWAGVELDGAAEPEDLGDAVLPGDSHRRAGND